jgi:MATE family multidrug resistance protein
MRSIPSRDTIRKTLNVALPSMVRTAFFAGGLTTLYWIVGQVGTHAGAAAQLVITLMLVAVLPGIGLGMAAASLVGQALGRGDAEDAKRWGWDVVKIAVGALAILGLPMLLVPDALLGFFIDDQATVAAGSMPLRVVGATIFIDGIGLVLQNAMLGAGDSRRIMVVAVALQWALFLPAAYVFGPMLGYGLLGIWVVQAVHRAIQAGAFAFMWHRGGWAKARV